MQILKILGLSLASLAFLGLNTFALHNPWFGGIFLLLYSVFTALLLGERFFPSFPRPQKLSFGFLVLLSELIIAGTAVYYGYKITPVISFGLLFLPILSAILFSPLKYHQTLASKETRTKNIFSWSPFVSLFLLIDFFLLLYLYQHRTYDLAASPWQTVSPLFFVLYFLATLLLFFQYSKGAKNWITYLLTSLHLFVGFSIAPLIYPLGYGFDAFIHRATEQWIFDHGFILPKTPYYIGQYSLVVVLAQVSALPLKLLDIYLLPILSSLLLPPIVMFSLETCFTHLKKYIPYIFWLVPFVPFLFFHLTTPHNIVVFFTLLSVFLLLLSIFEKIPMWMLFLVAIASIATHALVGVPLFVVIFFFFILQHIKNSKATKAILFFLILALALLLPLMFTFNALRVHAPLPEITNPLSKLSEFLQIFQRPYWYAKTSPWYFEIFYFCERLIIPVFLLLSGVGAYFLGKESRPDGRSADGLKKKYRHLWIFTTAFFGFVLSAFTLASSIVFPDVVAYEQKDYPMRLLKVSLLFLLPSSMYGAAILAEKIKHIKFVEHKKNIYFGAALFVLSLIFTSILYISYPQRNAKVRFPGYNVTSSDVKAVEWIHNQHNDYNYIVLANQLVSAAALDKYSFAKYFETPLGELFYYAIPTGGKLYEYYGAMIYQGQRREFMEEVMNRMDVDTAYFVVDRYWANSDKIIYGAIQSADEYYPIEDGKVWIFVYKR